MKHKFPCGHTGKGKYCHACENAEKQLHTKICNNFYRLCLEFGLLPSTPKPHVDNSSLEQCDPAVNKGYTKPFNANKVAIMYRRLFAKDPRILWVTETNLQFTKGNITTWKRVYVNMDEDQLIRSLVMFQISGFELD
jgi:hypothetical protein